MFFQSIAVSEKTFQRKALIGSHLYSIGKPIGNTAQKISKGLTALAEPANFALLPKLVSPFAGLDSERKKIH